MQPHRYGRESLTLNGQRPAGPVHAAWQKQRTKPSRGAARSTLAASPAPAKWVQHHTRHLPRRAASYSPINFTFKETHQPL